MRRSFFGPYLSEFDRMCQGAKDPNRYFVAANVAVASVLPGTANPWSVILEGVDAFDAAEVAEANLGQINCVTVSSFCSPQSQIWGLEAAKQDFRGSKPMIVAGSRGTSIAVFDGEPLLEATKELFGRGNRRKYPLAPGTICPVAVKSFVSNGPGILFSGCAFGMPANRKLQPVLIMEDVGIARVDPMSSDVVRAGVVESLARSVLAVGHNQGVRYPRVFVCYRSAWLASGLVGCSLAMTPYFALARHAMPRGGVAELRNMSLPEWLAAVPFL